MARPHTRSIEKIACDGADKYLSVAEAGNCLGVCAGTVRHYIDNRYLEGCRTLGGQRITTLQAVFNFYYPKYGNFPQEFEQRVAWLEDPMVLVAEVAKMLHCSDSHVRDLVDRYELPAILYPHGTRRFKLRDIKEFLEKRR